MTMRIVPLGTNGFFPSFGRQTMAFLVLTADQALLLDAGTGMARLMEKGIKELLEPYDSLDIVLSHYHLDHVIGLSFLPGTWLKGAVRIFGPGKPLVDAVAEEAIDQLLKPPLYSLTLRTLPTPVEVIPMTEASLKIGDLPVELWAQKHPGGSAGIRVAGKVAYITDTVVEQANQEFVRGVKLLLHEVWLTDAEAEDEVVERSRHSYESSVARFAEEAAVENLMLVHHHPKRTERDLQELARSIEDLSKIRTIVPEEGRVYEVG